MYPHWHLAIESSGLGGSVALFRHNAQYQGELHAQAILPANQGSVRSLAPAIDQLLRGAQLRVSQLSSLSVTVGPGSFTGLRVGLTTAKLLAWTANIPVVPVDTLEATACRFVSAQAQQASTCGAFPPFRLVTAINAFRKQVFTSSWHCRELPMNSAGAAQADLQCVAGSRVMDADQWQIDPWQSDLHSADPLWVSGSALSAYPLPAAANLQAAPPDIWPALAEQVGQLGLQGLAAGRAVAAQQLLPNYIRSSAAEEKLGADPGRASAR